VSAIAASCLLLASAAAAHPGHGLGGGSQSWLHYLSEPLHVAPLALAMLSVGLWSRRRTQAQARSRRR
jgi:hydrogenase/urease accessory protein HupE